jgi:lipoprotein-anchoring transpeptidase ErfK/SrfK
LLTLDRAVFARTDPSSAAPPVGRIAARTPLTGSPVVLPVLRSAVGPGGGNWLRVRLPTRPNEATGWVPASAGALGSTAWRIVVHRSARRAVVFEGPTRRAVFPVVLGKPSTPTPLGTFFVVEMLHLAPGVAEGPWALATSAYSNVLQEFDGGPGQVALHGTVGFSDPLGTFSSHGCIRFAPAAISWIAMHVDQGTPIVVTR